MQLSHGVSFRLSLAMQFSESRNATFRRNLATLEDFRRSLAEQLLPDFPSECQVLSGSPVRSVRGREAAVCAKAFSAPVKQTGAGSTPSASVS